MQMTFFWTTDLGELFFPGLNVNGVLPLALACLVVGVLSTVYEGIKVNSICVITNERWDSLDRWTHKMKFGLSVGAFGKCASPCGTRANCSRFVCAKRKCQFTCDRSRCTAKIILETFLQIVRRSAGFPLPQFNRLHLMLSCMVYSGWLFLAVVLSMGIGYFLFGHISMKINMENVQARSNTVICSSACPETGESVDGEYLGMLYTLPSIVAIVFYLNLNFFHYMNQTASKTTSPCRSISEQVNMQQQPCTSASATIHTPTAATVTCHQVQENQTVSAVNAEADEDCCCRL